MVPNYTHVGTNEEEGRATWLSQRTVGCKDCGAHTIHATLLTQSCTPPLTPIPMWFCYAIGLCKLTPGKTPSVLSTYKTILPCRHIWLLTHITTQLYSKNTHTQPKLHTPSYTHTNIPMQIHLDTSTHIHKPMCTYTPSTLYENHTCTDTLSNILPCMYFHSPPCACTNVPICADTLRSQTHNHTRIQMCI